MIICSPTACEFKERKHFSIVNNCSFIIDRWKAPKLLIIPNKLIMTYFKSGSSSIAPSMYTGSTIYQCFIILKYTITSISWILIFKIFPKGLFLYRY